MKIIHIEFAGPYTPGCSYQDNLLPRAQVGEEREVHFWTTCYKWESGNKIRVSPEEFNDHGVLVRRFPFQKILNDFITIKMRYVKGIYCELEKEKPDVIMLHDFQSRTVKDVCRYADNHKDVRFVVDCHTAFYNSARNFLSYYFLHGVIYKRWAKKCEKSADELFSISYDTTVFMREVYGIKKEITDLPLGGVILSNEKYYEKREMVRQRENTGDDTIVFVHTGKFRAHKNTEYILKAFHQLKDEKNVCLWIIGALVDEDITDKIRSYCEIDERIRFLGWKSEGELQNYLCASDVYVEPGGLTATVQNALCCRCAVIVRSWNDYTYLFGNSAIFADTVEEIYESMKTLNGNKLLEWKNKSYKFAVENLDYNILGKRVYGGVSK